MPVHIDPVSGNVIDDESRTYTYAAISRLRPPCPQCGTPVTVTGTKIEGKEDPGPTDVYMVSRNEFNCDCTWPAA